VESSKLQLHGLVKGISFASVFTEVKDTGWGVMDKVLSELGTVTKVEGRRSSKSQPMVSLSEKSESTIMVPLQ